jgi:hypothetical protein
MGKAASVTARSWTGIPTFREQTVAVRGLVPLASAEIDACSARRGAAVQRSRHGGCGGLPTRTLSAA